MAGITPKKSEIRTKVLFSPLMIIRRSALLIRQFIYYKNAPVRAWYQAEMDNAFIGISQFHGGGLNRVNITNQVGNGNIRGGQFFRVAFAAVDPAYWRIIAFAFHGAMAIPA